MNIILKIFIESNNKLNGSKKKLDLIFENNFVIDLLKDNIFLNPFDKGNKNNKEIKIDNFFHSPNEFNKELSYFRFRESIYKSSSIFSNPSSKYKENILSANFDIENRKIKPINKLRSLQIIHNPCFLRGYYNNKTKMSGLGDYEKCYDQLHETLSNKFAPSDDLKNKTSILLGSDFKDIADVIEKENIPLPEFIKNAIEICDLTYETAKTKYSSVKNLDNICFKFTYAIVIFEKLFGFNKNY